MLTISDDIKSPLNQRILSVSEDLITGFHPYPFDEIAAQSGVEVESVIASIQSMLSSGVIRRVRQTVISLKLANGALVAWKFGPRRLEHAFDFMHDEDPFSGHVVVRSTDPDTAGADYKLWTTLKVPNGEDLADHARLLQRILGADDFLLMPAKGVFTLGVGHMRRRGLGPGEMLPDLAEMQTSESIPLSSKEWAILMILKEELSLDEIRRDIWEVRAKKAKVSFQEFCEVAERLARKGALGRFSTFLEHKKKPKKASEAVTRFNGLFHWAVPAGMEERAGAEVGRHHCMTHAYWREAGAGFKNVNIMGVIHGTDKQLVLDHKAAIDQHLENCGIPVLYTAVFWDGRSEIKPSEICPTTYRKWHRKWENVASASTLETMNFNV